MSIALQTPIKRAKKIIDITIIVFQCSPGEMHFSRDGRDSFAQIV